MRDRSVLLSAGLIVALALSGLSSDLPPAPASIGFGVSVPYSLPVDWASSFSFVTYELLLTSNVTFLFDAGTYPASFPDLFEGGASLLVRGWLGPTVLYAGGGLSMQYRRVGAAWSLKPFLNLRTGYQIWVLDNVAVSLQFRSLEAFPIGWVLSPEVALGFNVGLGRARPEAPRYDGEYIWVLVGLAAAALIAFLPRQ
jgi:hypothetical protein